MKAKVICILCAFLLLPMAQCTMAHKENITPTAEEPAFGAGDTLINRTPAVAGSFYPGNREGLSRELTRLFSEATPDKENRAVVALIAPHAGYVYSGLVAASAYNQLSGEEPFDNVFIIGSSHHVGYDGAALYAEGNFITPLGMVQVNLPLVKELIRTNPSLFSSRPDVHAPEHSIEVQIPFLQYVYHDNLKIVPILVCTQKPATCRKIADALRPFFNGRNLFIISTDFSHYPGYQDAYRVDAITADAIVKNSPALFQKTIDANDYLGIPGLATSICGWTSMLTLLHLTEKQPGIHYEKIRYMNSGDIPGSDKGRVVGYHALTVMLNPEDTSARGGAYHLSKGEKDQLLRIARNSISDYLVSGELTRINEKGFSPNLLTHAGAFVTLNKHGNLRGCIGLFSADVPLYKVVQEMAVSAATRDNRFNPVTPAELEQLDIEISVLTPMRRIESTDEIVLGRHGIYIRKGNQAGTFLPQVATETGWNLQEFLGHCARDKAGLGWEGWKEAEIYVYEAYVFGEP